MNTAPRSQPTPSALIVEDDPWVAEHLQTSLAQWGWRVVGAVDHVAAALRLARVDRPDLALVDVTLQRPEDGIVLGTELRASHRIAVLFVTGHSDPSVHERAAEALPVGFVSKPFTDAQLYGAVTVALRQARASCAAPMAQDALTRIATVMRDAGFCPTQGQPRRPVPGLALLSEREREVLDRLLLGERPPRIAEALHISAHTVRNHLKGIYTKLDVHSQQELVDLMLRG